MPVVVSIPNLKKVDALARSHIFVACRTSNEYFWRDERSLIEEQECGSRSTYEMECNQLSWTSIRLSRLCVLRERMLENGWIVLARRRGKRRQRGWLRAFDITRIEMDRQCAAETNEFGLSCCLLHNFTSICGCRWNKDSASTARRPSHSHVHRSQPFNGCRAAIDYKTEHETFYFLIPLKWRSN